MPKRAKTASSYATLAVASGDEAGYPEQRALGFGVGQFRDGKAGGFGVGTSSIHGVVDRAMPMQNLKNLRVRDTVEASVGEDRTDGLSVRASTALQGMN